MISRPTLLLAVLGAAAGAGLACAPMPPATPALSLALAQPSAALGAAAPATAAEQPSGGRDLRISPARTGPAPSVAAEAAVAAKSPFAEPLAPREATHVAMLVYHSIDEGRGIRSVSPRALEAQILAIRAEHVEIIALSQLLAFLEGKLELPARVAVISIDDGEMSVYERAFPVLKRLGVPFVAAINTFAVDSRGGKAIVSWAMLRAMVESGWCEIASHGYTHDDLTRLPPARLTIELETSRREIEQHTGFRPQALVYPFGATNDAVAIDVGRAGYRAGFVAWGHGFDAGVPRMKIPRFPVVHGSKVHDLEKLWDRAEVTAPAVLATLSSTTLP